MKNVFSSYHPVVNLLFFCMVIGFGIFIIHPVYLCVALAAALAYGVSLMGKSMVKLFVLGMIPVILVVTVVNMLTNPRGNTVIYHMEYSQITMEAMVFGILTGVLLAAVMMWFACFSKVMTGDKLMFLFGRVLPAASLIFSMVMRFLPNYRRQIGRISGAQKGIGVSVSDGSLKSRIRHGAKIVSIMFTWALENSIETADSMRARGYGLKGRSSFSIYRFDRRDAATTVYILISAGVIAAALASGKCRMEFYPDVVMAEPDILGIAAGVVYALLCFMPVMMQAKEVILWKYLKSKI